MGFTLVAATRTSTSPGPGTGSGYSSNFSTSGPPYWWTTTAFIFHLLTYSRPTVTTKPRGTKLESIANAICSQNIEPGGRRDEHNEIIQRQTTHRFWRSTWPIFPDVRYLAHLSTSQISHCK